MYRFHLAAIADPQSLPRIAGFFAQRAITPAAMAAGMADEKLWVMVDVAGLEPQQATVIAAKLREIYAVTEAASALIAD